jgi:hypothetical protein
MTTCMPLLPNAAKFRPEWTPRTPLRASSLSGTPDLMTAFLKRSAFLTARRWIGRDAAQHRRATELNRATP